MFWYQEASAHIFYRKRSHQVLLNIEPELCEQKLAVPNQDIST